MAPGGVTVTFGRRPDGRFTKPVRPGPDRRRQAVRVATVAGAALAGTVLGSLLVPAPGPADSPAPDPTPRVILATVPPTDTE